MTAKRHPTAQVRSDYAAANIAPGAALAVAVHLEYCLVCAIGAEAMSASGAPLASDAGGAPIGYVRRGAAAVETPGAMVVPRPLQGAPVGRWRWLRPGVRAAALGGVSGFGEAVYLVKAAPDAVLTAPDGAIQQIVVLEGGLRHGEETYGPGDFADADSQPFSRLTAARPGGCLCLMVTDATWPVFGWARILRLFGAGG